MIDPINILRSLRNSTAFGWARIEREIDEEIRFHLEMRVDENLRLGMLPEQAHEDALRRFGDIDRIRTDCVNARLESPFRSLIERSRTTLLIAVGIGALLSVYILVDQTLLSSLPYQNSDRIVTIWQTHTVSSKEWVGLNISDFLDIRQKTKSFQKAGLYGYGSHWLIEHGVSEQVTSLHASAGYFEILNPQPWLGRVIQPGDDTIGAASAVLLSYSCWEQRYREDRNIIGKRLLLDSVVYTIIGVLSPDFRPYLAVDFVLPLRLPRNREEWRNNDNGRLYMMLAQLKPNVAAQQAEREITEIEERAFYSPSALPDKKEISNRWHVTSLQDALAGPVRNGLLILLIAVALLLLVFCFAAASRIVERAIRRGSEGRSRMEWYRFLPADILAPVSIGTVLGFLIGTHTAGILRSLLIRPIAHLFDPQVQSGIVWGTALLFILLVGALIAVVALGTRKGSSRWLRTFLLGAQISLSMIALTSAGITLQRLYSIEKNLLRFGSPNLLTMHIALPTSDYPTGRDQARFFGRAMDEIHKLPGVEEVSGSEAVPLRSNGFFIPFKVLSRGDDSSTGQTWAQFSRVGTDYHTLMGVPLISGRYFNENDRRDTHQVIIINRAMAEKFWPGKNPVGDSVYLNNVARTRTIVGVVENVPYNGIDQVPVPRIYRCYWQFPSNELTLILQTRGDAEDYIVQVRDVIRRIDPQLAHGEVLTGREIYDHFLLGRRTLVMTLCGIGLLALWVVLFSIRQWLASDLIAVKDRRELLRIKGRLLRPFAVTFLISLCIGLAGTYAAMSFSGIFANRDFLSLLTIYGAIALLFLSFVSLVVWLPARVIFGSSRIT